VDERSLALLAEFDQAEALAPVRSLTSTILVVALLASAALSVGVYLLAGQIARPILRVAEAARQVERETFETGMLAGVVTRQDEVGQLARVFQQMAAQVKTREAQMKQEIEELRIEIDEVKRTREVKQITQTDYFKDLKQKAKALREASKDQG
jgi:nitrate/nitrite-specific signal transduction histidine kinase